MKMKPSKVRQRIIVLLFFLSSSSSTLLYSQAAFPLLVEQPAGSAPWEVTQRDSHSETWESSEVVPDPFTGKTNIQRHRYVTMESGRNYLDENSTLA